MTIKEVAELAGVSSAAVSRYLNGGYLSDDKRARIREAIEQTGYAPSAQARALRTGSAHVVGVVVPKINSESVGRATAGISQVLATRGYQMLLANTDNHSSREVDYLELFQHHPVDGIILLATAVTPRHIEFLRSARVSVVVVGQDVEGANCIFHDDRLAARELAQTVARTLDDPASARIAFIGVGSEDRAVGIERSQGFFEGLSSVGASVGEGLFRVGGFSLAEGYAAARGLLAEHDDIDYIACATDTIAAGAIQALHEVRGRAAADAVVSGFGDNQFLRAVSGGIPTVHFGYRTSGVKAAQMLFGILDGETTVGMRLQLGHRVIIP